MCTCTSGADEPGAEHIALAALAACRDLDSERALLELLRRKGLPVDAAAQARITGCTDAAQLDTWAERLLAADSLADVFTEPTP